jgi:hypothetical protein
MREVIEERPEHDQAGARPAAPARPRPGRAEVALLTVAVALLGSVQAPHMFWETPADPYGTWAHGVSWMPAAPGAAQPARDLLARPGRGLGRRGPAAVGGRACRPDAGGR